MKTVTIRKMMRGQEKTVGRILYDTDPYIYPTAFGSKEYAGELFPELFKLKGSPFSADNIFVASDGDNILGCIVVLPDNSPDHCNYASVNVKEDMKDAFLDVCTRYIAALPAYLDDHPNAVYIPCICVDEKARGKGIGTQLIEYVIRQHPGKELILHVLEDNMRAIKLYASLGFEATEQHVNGYSYHSQSPLCCEMRRKDREA